MLNAYQLGVLTAVPETLTKVAAQSGLSRNVIGQLVKSAAIGPTGEISPQDAASLVTGATGKGGAPLPTELAERVPSQYAAAERDYLKQMEKLYGSTGASPEIAAQARNVAEQVRKGALPQEAQEMLFKKYPDLKAQLLQESMGPGAVETAKGNVEGAISRAGEKVKGWGKELSGISSDVNVALGGAKGKHARTIMALLAALGIGGAGAYAATRGGSRER